MTTFIPNPVGGVWVAGLIMVRGGEAAAAPAAATTAGARGWEAVAADTAAGGSGVG
jgi:hypothetical protein